jgi:hypothetical protein
MYTKPAAVCGQTIAVYNRTPKRSDYAPRAAGDASNNEEKIKFM